LLPPFFPPLRDELCCLLYRAAAALLATADSLFTVAQRGSPLPSLTPAVFVAFLDVFSLAFLFVRVL
jgi:hypothetical protein